MKLFKKAKDGGQASNATGYWLVEIKNLFSIVLLKFEGQSRENYHSHSFNALTWFLYGNAIEIKPDGSHKQYKRSLWPKYTPRTCMHKVNSLNTSWAFSLRGPWAKTWNEYNEDRQEFIELTNGRIEVRKFTNNED